MAKRKSNPQPELVRHDGGLCAHFVNSASHKRPGISSYADLLAWGRRAGELGPADVQRLGRGAGERPAAAEAVLEQAHELRDRLERILGALAEQRAPAAADVDALSDALGATLAARCLVPAARGGWVSVWGDRGGDDLDRMLWPVVLSAVETLSPRYYRKVRRCAGEDCDLLLVDRLPGRPRKRCRRCGDRRRSHRHYHTKVKRRLKGTKKQTRKRDAADGR